MRRIALEVLAAFTLTMVAKVSAGQTATVTGVVVQAGGGAPINNATVRLAGLTPATTNADGRFTIGNVSPGRYTLATQAVGFRVNVFALTITGDTTLHIALDRVPVQLDTVVVRAGDLTIEGQVRDATTQTRLLDAQVTLFPGDRTAGAMSGGFRLAEVPRGEITLVVDGFQHLPKEITFVASTDTSLVIDLDVDSVSLRMTALQVKRLEQRSNAVMLAHQSISGDDMRASGVMSVYEYISRRLAPAAPPPIDSSVDDVCIFYDDAKVAPRVLAGIPMETVERIEIFGSAGDMIRVYTTKYVSSLAGERQIPRIALVTAGTSRPIARRPTRRRAICP